MCALVNCHSTASIALPSMIGGFYALSILANVLKLPNKPPLQLSTFKNMFHFLVTNVNYQYHLTVRENLECFFGSREVFDIPCEVCLFVKVISVNPGFLPCPNVFQKGFFVVCWVEKFLTDCNTLLLLIVGRQTLNEFCCDTILVQPLR